jgi:hypothetical protein
MNSRKSGILSDTSKIFIKKIAKYLHEGQELSKTDIVTSPIYTSIESKIAKGSKYHLINQDIRHKIDTTPWVGQTLSFTIHKKQIQVFLHYPVNNIHRNKTKIENWFSQIKHSIYSWLFAASLESSSGCSTELNIYIYFTDFKKQLPAIKRTPISEIHVNTGFTFSCKFTESGKNEIYVYRKEEWFKVLIHESFHAFSLDFSNMSNESILSADRQVKQLFPLNIDLRYYETYCEMWAEIIQIIYLSLKNLMLNKFTEFERKIKMDQRHSIQQSIKILKHHNMSHKDLFEKTESAQIKRMGYREISPVISYYIIKSVFYVNIGKYIEWTTLSNRGSLNFHKSKEILDSYVALLRESHTDNYIKLIAASEKITGGDNHLQMSIFGIA